MTVVDDRSAATLMPIIMKHIRQGTTIFSDEWRSYSRLGSSGYIHLPVNHSENFVDPNTGNIQTRTTKGNSIPFTLGAHIQNIKSMWSQAKRKHKSANGTSDILFESYLQQ